MLCSPLEDTLLERPLCSVSEAWLPSNPDIGPQQASPSWLKIVTPGSHLNHAGMLGMKKVRSVTQLISMHNASALNRWLVLALIPKHRLGSAKHMVKSTGFAVNNSS
jgi:hypothetical protein